MAGTPVATIASIDKYRVVGILGEGGMGRVYEAVEPDTGRRVAIKTLRAELTHDGEMLARFKSEARALDMVKHEGLVKIYATGTLPSGEAYIVMEFLSGQALRRRLTAGPPPLASALHIAAQVAEVLAVVHEHKIVHRDLKPENIMLLGAPNASPQVKILDFGIAKVSTQTQSQTQIVTRTGTIFGTPTYMAPEQCGGDGEICDRTDVYALGVLLYEMLAGRPPFVGETDQQLIGKHLFQKPPPLRQVHADASADLELLVHAMLAKKGEQRPSMKAVSAAIAVLARGERLSQSHTAALHLARESATVHYDAGGTTARTAPYRERWFVAAIASLGLAVLLVGVVVWLSLRPPPAPPPVRVRWDLTSMPPGATVVERDTSRPLGKTPLHIEQQPESGTTMVIFRLAGFEDQSLPLSRSHGESATVALRALPPAAAAPPAAAPPAPPRPPASSSPGGRRRSHPAPAPLPARPAASPAPPAAPVKKPLKNDEIPLFDQDAPPTRRK
jgi:serine/threonine protein kinase